VTEENINITLHHCPQEVLIERIRPTVHTGSVN